MIAAGAHFLRKGHILVQHIKDYRENILLFVKFPFVLFFSHLISGLPQFSIVSLILIDIQAERDVFEVQRRGQGGARRPCTKDNTSYAEKTIRCVTSPLFLLDLHTPFLILSLFFYSYFFREHGRSCTTNINMLLTESFFFSSFLLFFFLCFVSFIE